LRAIGTYWPVGKLVEALLWDVAFYRHSGGGVTLSGGECTMFPGYMQDLLGRLKARDIHVAIETSGYFEWDVFSDKILPCLDLILFDLKIADRTACMRHTGRSNEKALENLHRLLARRSVQVHPRIPLIPGITDKRENLSAIVACLCEAGASSVSLLPYNPLGMPTYARLGKPMPDLPLGFMQLESERRVVEMVREIVKDIQTQKEQGRQAAQREAPHWTVEASP
jgi:pyruvate formate lyase activating enzyme